jgi:hypothetical protein
MTRQPQNDRRRIIAGVSLIAAPLLLLAGDLAEIGAGSTAAWYVMGKLAFAVFVPAILAIVHLLRARADRTGLAGGGLAIVGSMAGASIFTVAMVDRAMGGAAIDESAARAVEQSLVDGRVFEYVIMYPLPGLAFPIGLLVLSVGLLRAKVVSPAAAVLLALGAILFPVGRIGDVAAAVVGSGAALTAGMGSIGLRVLGRANGWGEAEG